MARVRVRLDHPGIEQILKGSKVRAAVHAVAARVEANIQADPNIQRRGMPVNSRAYTNDRAVVNIAIAHPGGLGMQAKHGVMTRAAGAAGLEVREAP